MVLSSAVFFQLCLLDVLIDEFLLILMWCYGPDRFELVWFMHLSKDWLLDYDSHNMSVFSG